jgi:hypothetical protein
MSFNRVIPHYHECYIELVIDGYEDWESAVDTITEMADIAERHELCRFLIDFSRVDMRVSPAEAPDVAAFFNSFCPAGFCLGIILPDDVRAGQTVRAFATAIGALGHPVSYLETSADRAEWIARGRPGNRRAGAA